jgi:hypothetical protein
LRAGFAEAAMAESIRAATRRGNPLGSEGFVELVGRALGRDLRTRPPGRPAKKECGLVMAPGVK